MATTTWYADADARIAFRTSDSWQSGAGTSSYNPFGLYSGYRYRTLLGFSPSFAGMVSITGATLYLRTSVQNYVAFGSSPQAYVQRLTADFTEGTLSGLGANAVTWANQPSSTTTNRATLSPGTTESVWVGVDVTAMIQDAFSAGTFYGFVILATDENSASRVGEFYSRETGSTPYIVVTYTTNTAPNAPTLTSPIGGTVTGLTPTLNFTHSDPQGDALSAYALQVSTDSSFASVTHWNISGQTAGISGNSVARAYGGTALSTGTTYYWRACTADPGGLTGPWSAAGSFVTASPPTATLTEPSATGRLGKTSYTGGSGWAAPRLNVGWSFSCPNGGTQQSYEVDVANDSAGSPGSALYGSGTVAGTSTSLVVPSTLTEGAYYHVRVRATCSHGLTSSYSGYVRIRVRWGVVVHRYDMTSPPVSLSLTTLSTTTGASNGVTVEFATNTTTSTPGTWFASIGEAGLNQYFFYRAWLLAWGASPATSPSLDQLVISYSTNQLSPDKWTLATAAFADPGSYVYGTQSLKHTGAGALRETTQRVDVLPNTDYILSARIKSLGNSGARIRVQTAASGGTVLVSTASVTAGQDWTRTATAIWNSGSNTSVYVSLVSDGLAGTAAWFDAVKFEASRVVTPWTPSFLADAVILDAGGLQIDAQAGGIFRLKGSSGGARDRIDLGANGLKFGGQSGLELSSDIAGRLKVNGGLWVNGAGQTSMYAYISGYPNTSATPGSWLPVLYLDNADNSGSGQGVLELRINSSRKASVRWDTSGNLVLNPSGNGRVYLANDEGLKQIRMGAGSFPAAATASDGDLFFHTGHNRLYIWLASVGRWLSEQIFTVPMLSSAVEADAGAANRNYWSTSLGAYGTEVYVEGVHFVYFAGTNNGSNYWNWTLYKRTVGNAVTSLAAGNTSGLAANNWVAGFASANALLSPTTYPEIDFAWTKTGTPSAFYAPCVLTLRTAFPGT